jgi:hypothetical protein
LQLTHNEWDPVTKTSRPKVLHSPKSCQVLDAGHRHSSPKPGGRQPTRQNGERVSPDTPDPSARRHSGGGFHGRDGVQQSLAAPPSTPAPAPPAATPQVPGQVIDLANWYLTLPTGKENAPDNVYQPELSSFADRWFRLNDSRDGVVFTANAGGVTTKNSGYPRSELREMNGSEKASWSNTNGTHTLRLRQAVTELPAVKPQVVTAQIHDGKTT